MAQTNFTPILLYGSSTPGNVPLAANLLNTTNGSEIAVNVADKNLFFKDSGGVVNTVPIRQSSTSSNGWLSSTDWNTFNNKTSNLGTVTSVAALTLGTTGTDLSSTVANGTTTPVITLNVPTASASNRGALSSTDWSTFNGKQAALVSGTNIKTVSGVSLLGSGDVGTIGTGYGGTGLTSFTSGGIVYATSTSALTTSSNFNWASGTLIADGGVGGGRLTFETSASKNQIYSTTTAFGSYIPFYYTGSAHAWFLGTTQAMTLDSSNNLLIGVTSSLNSAWRVQAENGATSGQYSARSTTAGSGKYWHFGASTNAYIIYNQGDVGQYMVDGATSWSANSDERLKTELQPFVNASEKVASIRAGIGRYLTDEETVSRSFLIAQDVQKVLPEAVDVQDNEEKTLGLRYVDLIPLLVAAIQEQQILIEKIKQKVGL